MMSDKFKIIQVTIDDIPRLCRFLGKNNTSGVRNEKDWRQILEWMWMHNPSVTIETKLGWALEDIDGIINGFIGNVPVMYRILNEESPVIWGTSWYVSEEAKALSLKMYIRFTQQSEIIFSNTQSPRVEVVMKKIGFTELTEQWFNGAYIFSLSVFSKPFLLNSFKGLALKKIGLGFLGILGRLAQALLCTLSFKRKFAKELKIEKIDDFSKETDEWFEAFSSDKDCIFIRSQKNYEWLFCRPESQGRFLKYKVEYQQKNHGFLVFKKIYIKDFNFLEIIDEALLPLPEKTYRQLLLKIISNLRKEAGDTHFLILRSNMERSMHFFKLLGGVKYNKYPKGYIKIPLLKPTLVRPLITSIDGDSLFF
jgi:hypothetical protein